MRPGNDNFIAAHRLTDAFDIKRQPLIEVIALCGILLGYRHNCLGASDIDNHIRSVKPENHAGYNAAYFSLIIRKYCLFFCLTDTLEDNLFGGLSRNAAKSRRGHIFAVLKYACFAGIRIEVNGKRNELVITVIFAVRSQNCSLNRF